MPSKKKILYIFPAKSTFILRDIQILSEDFEVIEGFFNVSNKKKVPFEFIKQFFFLLRNIRKVEGVFCHFAGYSSLIPAFLGKIFNKPCLIIVAGNDASKFPDFHYGNYTRKLLGFATSQSLRMAKHILPVHESLYYQSYGYYEGGAPAQGYSYFVPSAKNIPYTAVYYGYDINLFKIQKNANRVTNSFLTIGNLSDPYSFKRKGYDLIIEVAKLHPDCTFTLVGWDGKMKIETTPNVQLLPFMDQNEVIETFSKNEYYLQLSIMEGFPNALAEAMLCGCIPIGSNVSGIPYIIKDTGFILNHRSVSELSNIIIASKGLTKQELQLKSIEASERISKEFTFENRKTKMIEILNKYC
jgi:glycosyltransferase involved in cell wall biosynthesis